MKLVIGAALLGVMVHIADQDSTKIAWKNDYATGLKTAQETGKLAVVHFGGEG
jgi:hypothetical protein